MDRVCRTCMRIIAPNETAVSINETDLRQKLEVCLPELVLDSVVDPKMCTTCRDALSLTFRFKGMCNEAERTINNCLQHKNTEGATIKALNDTDLISLRKIETPEVNPNPPLRLGELEKAEVSLNSLRILSDVASAIADSPPKVQSEVERHVLDAIESVVSHQSQSEVSDDVVHALENLLDTPEYRQLVQLRAQAGASDVIDRLQRFEVLLEDRTAKLPPKKVTLKSIRALKRLEEINDDLAEISDGVRRQEFPNVEVVKCEPDPPPPPENRKTQPPQTCKKCGKIFKYTSHLRVHMRAHLHLKTFKCELCTKSFSLERNLLVHTMMHFSAGEHQCPVCEKYLSSWHVLKKHQLTHSDKKPHVCHICSRAFVQKGNLKTHQRTHSKTKEFVCFVCNLAFGQKAHLKGHMRTHTGEKPFECDVCPKAFAKKNVLKDHKALHVTKPFMCDGCHTLFRNEFCLNRHLYRYRNRETHTKNPGCEKAYSCGICGRSFMSKWSRDRHMKVHVKDLIECTIGI